MGTQVQKITAVVSGIQLALIAYVYSIYDFSNPNFQLEETYQWIRLDLGNFGKFHVNYALGIDGLSLGLIILTGFISFIAIINSHVIKEKLNGYFSLILLLFNSSGLIKGISFGFLSVLLKNVISLNLTS